MKRSVRVLAAVAVCLAASVAHAADRPSYNAGFDLAVTSPVAPPTLVSSDARARDALVAHRDPMRGVPTFVWAPSGPTQPFPAGVPAEVAARAHLAAYAPIYGVSGGALDTLELARVSDTGRGGIVVTFTQTVLGVPLFHADVKLLLRRDLSLVAISGAPHPDAVPSEKARGEFTLSERAAVARALGDLYDVDVPLLAIDEHDLASVASYTRYDLAAPLSGNRGALRLDRPARLRPVLFPLPDRLIPSYYVELFAHEEGDGPADAYAYVISATDGRLLYRASIQQNDAYAYRVWADPVDARPLDGPIADFTPNPTGLPDGGYPSYVAPSLITIEGFDQFMDPWLPPGATQTTGNNVDAYTDHDNPDGFGSGDVRGSVTTPGVFDRVYDVTKAPLDSSGQEMASVTEAFYVTNWLHDYWYDSGFDEVAGNAQASNYGRGGQEGDPMLVEAQDGALSGSKNNANMSTPEDGSSPQMQMFLWDGRDARSLDVVPLNQSLGTGKADFGPQSFNVAGNVTLVADGTAPVTDACENVVNSITGTIALVDRGTCTFASKAQRVQAAGGIGMILVNNQANQSPPDMPGNGAVTIPVLSISMEDGAAIKAALASGPVTATMSRTGSVDADGSIDNSVIAHEWGHYIHHRLVSCGTNQCDGQSEGWGDFDALMMMVRPTDDLAGTFAEAIYAEGSLAEAGYYGIRRMPYSTDMTKNSLTFKHIMSGEPLPSTAPIAFTGDNAEVHNTGEVWCSMLWEGYASMLAATKAANPPYTFEEGHRRMADYVVAGLQLAPADPTFTEQRDGILAAAFTADPADGALIAQGFAKRGAGSCAVSPAKDSNDNSGVVESFTLAPELAIADIALDDSVDPCDNDGVLDAGETGHLTVTVANRGTGTASGTTVTVTSTTPGIAFPNGAQVTLPDLAPFASGQAVIEVAIEADASPVDPFAFDVSVVNASACTSPIGTSETRRVDYDNVSHSSATDSFDSDIDVWTTTGASAADIWAKTTDASLDSVWHGSDVSGITDSALVSPPLTVGTVDDLVLSFSHRHSFETGMGTFWDAGVVEFSTDAGATWTDVATIADPGYGGTVGNQADNPLADQQAFVSENPSWPARDPVSVNLGTALAGQTIQIRFRIGTDQAVGDFGWEINDVGFTGLADTPFPSIVEDQTAVCPLPHPPVADAGPDQTVTEGDLVTLDASNSSDQDGDALTFTWTQTAGPPAVVTPQGATATFTAPDIDAPTDLSFDVKVDAVDGSSTDSVVIHVLPEMGTGGAGGSGGSGGSGAGGAGGEGAASPSSSGSGASGPDGSSATSTGSGTSPPGPSDDGGCGCRVAGTAAPTGGAAAAISLALAALARRRRRRS